jgi:hypothetical protein
LKQLPCWKVRKWVFGTSFRLSHLSGRNSAASVPHISVLMLITRCGKCIIESFGIFTPSYTSSATAWRAVIGTDVRWE